MMTAPVVITGAGAISPLGLNAHELWQGLSQGRCGIRRIKAFDPVGFPCQLAGEAPDYRLRDFIPKSSRKSAKLMSRDIELAVIAAQDAFNSAGLRTKATDPDDINIDPTRFAINLGAGLISCDLVELAPAVAASIKDGTFNLKEWGKTGIEQVTPLWLLKYLPNMLPCHISIIHDLQGPSNTITCAEASAHLSIIEATQVIQRAQADMALAGGAEAKVNPIVMARQCLVKRTTPDHNDSPQTACRPFDAQATGAVFGEGAGLIILEHGDLARRRQAPVLAEIAGFGQSNSINPAYERIEPDGRGIQIAVEKALASAHIGPADLDLVIPHGTGIPGDDQAESHAVNVALGDCAARVPVWPTKSMLSNTGAASGALDVIAALYAMKNSLIPAARNCDEKAKNCQLNILEAPVQGPIRYALCCSYTYGGQTAALVLKNPHIV
jgi:3-oxoacyl-[acyl-carrier-protein] synthase II